MRNQFKEEEEEYKQIIDEMENELKAKEQLGQYMEKTVDQLKEKLEDAGFETFQEIKKSIFDEEMSQAKE